MPFQDKDTVKQYKELFEAAPIAYHELNVEGVVQRVNRTECELLEFSRDEIVGYPIWKFVCPEEQESSRASFLRKISGDLPTVRRARTYKTKSGREIAVEVYDHLLRDTSGKIIGVRTAMIDVTKRMNTELHLAQTQVWLNSVFTSLPTGILILDTLGLVRRLNPCAEGLIGWNRDCLIGKPLLHAASVKLYSLEPGGRDYNSIIGITEPWSGYAELRSQNGELRRFSTKTSPLLQDKACIGIVVSVAPPEENAF